MELQLTKSENKVVRLKALGYSEKQIACMRFNSVHTIKKHVKNALKRNAISNGFELVARYAATHPDIFKNMVVVLFLAIQCLISLNIEDNYKNQSKRQKHKTIKLRRGRKGKVDFGFDLI